MSLILKGVDLPDKNLRVICLFPHGVEELVVLDADSGATAGRPIDVIQIPKEHGRLIDIEKLKEEFAMKNNICKECDSFKECDNKTYSKSEICEKFIWVSTILEAEES